MASVSSVLAPARPIPQLFEPKWKGSLSPLAGIRYAETGGSVAIFVRRAHRFSPLAGIRYVETSLEAALVSGDQEFQSPCGD